jgi:molybdopterin-guanine dinucleotide biosynthesis protein MobB
LSGAGSTQSKIYERRAAIFSISKDYASSERQATSPPVIAVCGLKNSGKTTVLCGLIPFLRDQGLKVAVAKHDGHDFVPDVPGTDSFRFREAGAETVAVFSSSRYLLTVERPETTFDTVLDHLRDADLILLEGGKSSLFPKIEVIRGEIDSRSVCDPETLLAVCTDLDFSLPGIPLVALTDYQGLARIILWYIRGY